MGGILTMKGTISYENLYELVNTKVMELEETLNFACQLMNIYKDDAIVQQLSMPVSSMPVSPTHVSNFSINTHGNVSISGDCINASSINLSPIRNESLLPLEDIPELNEYPKDPMKTFRKASQVAEKVEEMIDQLEAFMEMASFLEQIELTTSELKWLVQ